MALVTSFILLTRGPKSKQKFDILNSALIYFVRHHKMIKIAAGMKKEDAFSQEFQSTSWETMLKTLFLYFGEFGVLYKHPSDFTNVRGAYTALLDYKFNKIAKERVDFGSLPNRSAIDISFFNKIGIIIKEGMIKPYTVYDDLILLINFLVGVHFMLRGRAKHASLTWSNFRILEITSGKYLGRKKLGLVNLQDKFIHVSVKNPFRRDNSGCLDLVQCLENKLSCVVYWVIYYRTLCPPNQHRFYCYKAHQKLIKVSIRIF